VKAVIARLHPVWDRLVWGAGEDAPGFARRLFWTSLAGYALFLNPYLQSSMTWNFLDLAASLVETGRPYLAHVEEYGANDTAQTAWGIASGEPVGPSLPVVPLYVILQGMWGGMPVPLTRLNVAAVLFISIPAAATTVVLIYLQTRRYCRDERWCRLLAWFGAFGTQVFPISTMYTKEMLGTLACVAAFHLASLVRDRESPPAFRHVAAVGLLASVAGLMVYPLWILVPGFLWHLRARLDPRGLICLLLGTTPAVLLLLAYNQATFGHPFLVGYLTLSDPQGGRFALPSLRILRDLTLGPAGGLFFYHPVLALAPIAVWHGWRRSFSRRDVGFAGGVFVILLFVYGAWLEPHLTKSAFAASAGFRMLLPAVPLLVCSLGALEEKWRSLGIRLGVLSVLSSVAFASSGLIPSGELATIYIVKVAVTTLASGLLFADFLPRVMEIETLHTAIASRKISGIDLWGHPDLAVLMLRQLAFRLVSLGLFLAIAAVLARVRFADAAAPGKKAVAP
jgi:hypothetical protein